MTVRVTDTSGALWTFVDDEGGHTGQADPSTVTYGQQRDGTEDRNVVVIPCPVPDCGSVSWWPRAALPQTVQDKMPA